MYELKSISEEILNITESSWYSHAAGLGLPQIDFEKIITWARIHTHHVKGVSTAYGIFESKNQHEVVAIVDIVHTEATPRKGWMKMISVSLSPIYSASEVEGNADKLANVLDIYVASILGTIQLSDDHNAEVIKIFGRNDGLNRLLIKLKDRLSANMSTKVKATMEGRWLVISAI